MGQNISKVKDLAVGDLVTHILYGEDWVGMILGFKSDDLDINSRSEKALVQIQPGTKFENFFKNKMSEKDRINENLGYVTTNWLFRIQIKVAKTRSPRRKTPKS
tara:strand:- start:1389 stop:1700 length:312 start_codon:yes stop_codon:yes gene_type:complete